MQPKFRPKYNVRIEERIHLIQLPRDYYPDVSIIRHPLCPPDDDVVLDLLAVFERNYDISGYEDFINNREPPPLPPLNDEELTWLDGLLREKGFGWLIILNDA